jgi:hypothetical protein
MNRSTRTVRVALALLALAVPSVQAQAPDAATLEALPARQRMRANGPAIRDAVGLSVSDVLFGGLGRLFVRPPAEGVVVEATPQSLRFSPSGRSQPVTAPWAQVDYVDTYRGRSVPIGTFQGAAAGALTGLVGWGVIELIFLAADNPVVEEPEIVIGIGALAGALLGAATLGERWERVYPPR